jgi:hypothetical protein
LPVLAPSIQGSACQLGEGPQVGVPWRHATGVLWTPVHKYGQVQTRYGQVHNRIQSIETEAPHMISKGCKSLAEADFPIAEESRHATREWTAAEQAWAVSPGCSAHTYPPDWSCPRSPTLNTIGSKSTP